MTDVSTKKIALITGGATGIGFAIAKKMSDDGLKVILVGRRQEALDKAVQLIGNDAVAIAADVSLPADLAYLFSEVAERFGHLDVLVANAGFGVLAALGEITEEQFDQQFAVNVKGVVFTLQSALPLLGKGSSVVIVGSTASMDPGPGLSIYGATKAALRNLVRSWLSDLKGSGIRLNIVSPGPTNTESLRNMFGDNAADALAFLNERSPIGRIGEPEEIAAVAAFLASDAASYINGIELFADGGASQV
ncbi:SDR family oxidoreductase [Pseudomonas sp. MM211]|uniref:SDR family NAD(P)-dependent oxidoreductase n=1 Tax=Pseudomonas sp. MM211 TaxID=2866808 RepID=UPI001CED922C|nr:SDR family oxidoreductase [Pseudomonas sp. MM211]UCJ14798.1 SDR family oxidoreductase [Pseudomonas sp. MM211]